MVKSKAIDIIRSFSAKELKLFGDFVRSPFFNKNMNLVNLYEILKNEYPDFNSTDFTKENIFRRLYPDRKYKDNEMRRNFSDLLKLSEKFLVQSNLNDSDAAYNLLYLTELFTRNIDRLFDIKFKEITERYKGYADVDDVYFKEKYDIEILRKNVNSSDEGSRILFNIDNIFKNLAAYSTIAGLKLSQDINVLRRKMNIDYSDSLINRYFENFNLSEYLEDIKKTDEKLYKIMKIYYLRHLIAAGSDRDDSYYYEMKSLVNENLRYFSRREKYNIGLFLENSISEKIREGKSFFLTEAQENNELRIKEGIIKFEENEYLGIIIFRKIIDTALRLNKKEWAAGFIENNLKDLPPQAYSNVKNYSNAMLSFSSGDYKKALQLVSKINKYYDHNFEFISKSIKLKCLYELGYIEDIYYTVDSYRHSLKNNNTLPEPSKVQFRNFIYFLERCIKLKLNNNKSGIGIAALEKEFSAAEMVLEREWITEKMNELKS